MRIVRWLARASVILGLGASAACTSHAPPSLMIGLNTNDLVISEDTNLVGLYLSQLAEDGRVLHVDAYEATPLRLDDGTVRVPFPASLVLVDGGGETVRVRARLVAYHHATHDVLTMREARVAVPKEQDTQRLLTLNLFFTNQGNVVDANAGAPVVTGAALTEADLERFVSVCDGAPAPANRTAGEDGHCTDLDVPDLPLHDAKQKVPGSVETDVCYDVGRAFDDASVLPYPPSALADDAAGDCRLVLPQAFDPASLNVALATTGAGFTTSRGAVRPLASGSAFSLRGDVLTFPARVCALARQQLVTSVWVSPHRAAWRGQVPVCAPWTGARTPDAQDAPEVDASSSSGNAPDATSSSSGGGSTSSSSGAPAVCGDGTLSPDVESCDDGNLASGDGCSNTCGVEPFFTCPAEGGACTASVMDFLGTVPDFGMAAALSRDGLTLAVGQPGDQSDGRGANADPTPGSTLDSGAVRVYHRDAYGSPWTAQAYLKALNAKQGDRFGSVVALSDDGNVLAVGAPHESSDATGLDASGDDADNDYATGSGAAYSFVRDADGHWTQAHFFKASDATSDDGFGSAVAISGNGHSLVVGAPSAASEDGSTIGVGAAYEFDDDDGALFERALLRAEHPIGSAQFGAAVSISQDERTLVVGSPNESYGGSGIDPAATGTVATSGAVDVYVRPGQTWSHQVYLKASAVVSGAQFGTSLALSGAGDRLVVGAPGPTTAPGAAYAFSAAGATWVQDAAVLQASNAAVGDSFGRAVALSGDGNLLLICAVFEDSAASGLGGNQADDSLPNAGAAYLFRREASFTQRSYLKAFAPSAGMQFGYAVTLDGTGTTAAVGGAGVPRLTVFGH